MKPNNWILRGRPDPQARLRLFCLPYAGGGASIFRDWSRALPAFVEICPVQLPGRENRFGEKPYAAFDELLSALTDAILPYLDKPYAIFGHSMGGLLGFELIRALRRQGESQPAYFFVSAYRAPDIPERDDPIHELPDERFKAELARMKGTPAAVLENEELLQIVTPTLRADLRVCFVYAYTDEPPLSCPVAAFAGIQDEKVPPTDMEAWRRHVANQFSLHVFPGDHFFLHPYRWLLLQTISERLAAIL